MHRGTLYIISAPSGAGKTSLVKALCEQMSGIGISVSTTTRAQRPGEENGVDYWFVDQQTFEQKQKEGDFLESARVFDHFYGTSKSAVETQLTAGEDVILEIDWQGARQVRELMPEHVSVFILPPSREVLETRLRSRGQDSEDVIARRMQDAVQEISHYNEYQYLIINDDFATALSELRCLVMAQRQKMTRAIEQNQLLIQSLLE
ncbi:MAG TPA: guanylate kinase [Chromatiales bacterium]|nr:guanylate kinase [Thiotrichales bacterium]HIP67138.1 guanylate kinase [Chromatiales bacterium]